MVELAEQVLPAGGKRAADGLQKKGNFFKRLSIAAQCITTIPSFF